MYAVRSVDLDLWSHWQKVRNQWLMKGCIYDRTVQTGHNRKTSPSVSIFSGSCTGYDIMTSCMDLSLAFHLYRSSVCGTLWGYLLPSLMIHMYIIQRIPVTSLCVTGIGKIWYQKVWHTGTNFFCWYQSPVQNRTCSVLCRLLLPIAR